MPYLNAQIPTLRCYVRHRFLHDQEWRGPECDEPKYECDIIGIKSAPGRVLGFHVLMRNGAVFWDIPIHGLALTLNAQQLYWGRLQAWNCFSADVAVTCFERLATLTAVIRPLSPRPMKGAYHCTLDWTALDPDRIDTTVTRLPAEHKAMHLLGGHDGNLYLMPNNKLAWLDPAFVVEPFPQKPTYKTNTHWWSAEDAPPTENSDKAFVSDSH